MKSSLLTLILLTLSSITLANSNQLETYKQAATKLYQQLEEQNPVSLESHAKQLVDLSKDIVKSSLKALPQCEAYFSALLKAADTIATLPLDEIERGYHADGKLPALTDGTCYHTKDLLVHPATVQAMARIGINSKKDWESAEHEIEEVLEHLSLVGAVMANHK